MNKKYKIKNKKKEKISSSKRRVKNTKISAPELKPLVQGKKKTNIKKINSIILKKNKLGGGER